MAARDSRIEHLLRRAGFGASQQELDFYVEQGFAATVDDLVNFERWKDRVDGWIGQSGYVNVTTRGTFSPNTVITDARQRWLFRMVHTTRPLQEKMALFWHNHFATAYSKVAGLYNGTEATRMMAAKPSEDAAGFKGQYELLREHALGNFRDLLVEIAKDVAMLVWLDGRTNTRRQPQENFARELMELFTFGVGHYTEDDVYAGAKVFTGWNLQLLNRGQPNAYYAFNFNASQHDDTSAKTFSFPIYPDGSRTIRSTGMQEGLDLINGCAAHPETGRYLGRKLYAFFINELSPPPADVVDRIAAVYYSSGYNMRQVVRAILLSPEFSDPANYWARYSWPIELVIRAIKEIGWIGYSVNSALTPLTNMGQQLFEPPDVAGWALGQSWFSTGSSLARMNFAADLATNQRFNLRDTARPFNRSPDEVLTFMLDRVRPSEIDAAVYADLLDYARAGSTWTGSDAQLLAKAPGLAHLIAAMSEYQFA